VPRAKRVCDNNPEVWFVKGCVIVAPVPDDDVCLLLGRLQNSSIVRAGIYDHPVLDVWLVFFAFLDRALVKIKVLNRLKTLHGLLCKIAVRHWMANRDGFLAEVLEDMGDPTRYLAFSAAGSYCRNRDHGFSRQDHRCVWIEQREFHAMGGDLLTTLVNVVEMHVRVGENDLVDFVVLQEFIEQFFRHDRVAVKATTLTSGLPR